MTLVLGEILAILLRILYQNKLDHTTLVYFHKHLPDLAPRSLYATINDSILSGGAELKRLQQEFAHLLFQLTVYFSPLFFRLAIYFFVFFAEKHNQTHRRESMKTKCCKHISRTIFLSKYSTVIKKWNIRL